MERFICGYGSKEFAKEINSYTDEELISMWENGEDYDDVYARELVWRASFIDSSIEEEWDKATGSTPNDDDYYELDVDLFMAKVFATLRGTTTMK